MVNGSSGSPHLKQASLAAGIVSIVIALLLVAPSALVVGDNLENGDLRTPGALRFVVLSDIHRQIDDASLCIEDIWINEGFPKIEFVILTGDQALHGYQCPNEDTLKYFMVAPGEDLGWSDLFLPYFVLWGNHDATSYDIHPDEPYFVPEEENEFGRCNPFYSFEHDNILFLVVSSGLGDSEVLDKPQRDWLKQVTSMYPDKTTFLFTHRPPHDTTAHSTGRCYAYSMDTYSWWEPFLENNPQIILYSHGHTSTGSPFHVNKFGTHVIKNAMNQHGDSNQMTYYEVTGNRILVKYWNADTNEWSNTVMDEPVDTTYAPEGFRWFANPHIAQDGENFTWTNRILAEKYKLLLIGEGDEDRELVWMNENFQYYDPPTNNAPCLWVGYENDWNNGSTPEGMRDPAGYCPDGHVTFSGVDTFATATWYEDQYGKDGVVLTSPNGGFSHVGGKIPWTTTPWAIPGKEYRLRVRMRADTSLENAIDVSVMVLGENLKHVVMKKTPVLSDLDLTPDWEWYENTFTVPDDQEAWIIKTIWDSKQEGENCYLDAWSVTRADNTGVETEDFWVDINGENHSVSGVLHEGGVRTFDLQPTAVKNDLNISVGIGGSRVGMFMIIYENPFLWSDDISIGVNSIEGDAYNCHFEMVSQFTPNYVSLSPLQDNVRVEGANPVHMKGYTAGVMENEKIPGDYIVSVPLERPPWFVDDDGEVGLSDLMQVAGHFGGKGEPGWIPSDVDGDGEVGLSDLMMVAGHWGEVVRD